jgi:hypothetical protein
MLGQMRAILAFVRREYRSVLKPLVRLLVFVLFEQVFAVADAGSVDLELERCHVLSSF